MVQQRCLDVQCEPCHCVFKSKIREAGQQLKQTHFLAKLTDFISVHADTEHNKTLPKELSEKHTMRRRSL